MSKKEQSSHYQNHQVKATSNKNVQSIEANQYEGLIPHPEIMDGYKENDPEFPKMIMNWTSDNLKHSRKLQSWSLVGGYIETLLHNIFGFAVASILCYTGYRFADMGYPNQGSTIIVTTIVGSIGVFIIRKQAKSPKE